MVAGSSEKSQKFLDGHSSVADEGAKGACRQLFVLGNGKIDAQSGFRHHEMASDLTDCLPSRLLEGFRRFLAGNVGEPRHLARPRREFQVAYDSGRWKWPS